MPENQIPWVPIVTGVFTLAGVAIGQLIGLVSGYIERKNRKQESKRQNLKALADAISASLDWTATLQATKISDIRSVRPNQICRNITTSAMFHSDELAKIADRYSNCIVEHYLIAIDMSRTAPLDRDIGTQQGESRRTDPNIDASFEKITKMRQELDVAVAAEIRRLGW